MKKLLPALFLLLVFAANASALDAWWNASWHYRVKLEVNSSSSARAYWPIEQEFNFTQLLAQQGSTAAFDNNSLRVIEYNSTGGILWELPSQFDAASSYSSSVNAVGAVSFLMNGSTAANTKRIFFVYFDSATYAKSAPAYSTKLTYVRNGDEFNVNNTLLKFFVDTQRGENSSGLYRVEGSSVIFSAGGGSRTIEFHRYSNGTHNFSFDFRNNITLVNSGPIRLVIELRGNETYYNNIDGKTGQGLMVKRYVFYENNSWVRVTQNYSNTAGSSITRNSTNASALALDALASFGSSFQHSSNFSSPAPWAWAAPQFGGLDIGVISVNQSGTTKFSADNNPLEGLIGINLSTATIPAGSFVFHEAVLRFNDTEASDNTLQALSLALANREQVTSYSSEAWNVTALAQTNYSIHNRGETVLIKANVSADLFSLVTSANATVDNGTPSDSADDFNLTLYDDGTRGDAVAGDKVFTNNFTLTSASATGRWNYTVRAYNASTLLLAINYSTFNVTDAFVVNTTVLNSLGLVERQVNASVTVRNYRLDAFIAAANVSCSFNGTSIPSSNVTDFNNGSYLITFYANSQASDFLLSCSASKTGNNGTGTSLFSSESFTTNLNVSASPAAVTANNITVSSNTTFTTFANASNTGNGTAYAANFSLSLPAGWQSNITVEQCGDLNRSKSCLKAINVTIATNTTPGIYSVSVNVTWRNPNSTITSNTTNVTVNVTSNPLMETQPANLSGFVPPGQPRFVGNFTVRSRGNDVVANISFSTTGFPSFTFNFTPANVSSILQGDERNVSVNASVPAGFATGTYDGFINISTTNAGSASIPLRITVTGTNVTVIATPAYITVNNVTVYANNTFQLFVNATNTGNVSAYASNISLVLPPSWAVNSSLEQCGNITAGGSCGRTLLVTVANGTLQGNYTVNATVNWSDPEISLRTNKTTVIVNVSPTFLLNTTENSVSGNASHNETKTVANFTLRSDGNDGLLNITYNITGFNFTVYLVNNVTNLSGGATQLVLVNATVPFAFDDGTYAGWINISSANGGYKNVSLQIIVQASRTWTVNRTECVKVQVPDAATACVIRVNNTGNSIINFTVIPPGVNFTNASNASFSIAKQSFFDLVFTYNVSNTTKVDRNSTYVINTTQASTPSNVTIIIALTTFRSLTTAFRIVPNLTQATTPVLLELNVSDDNAVGFANASVNVTDPKGNWSFVNLTLSLIYNGSTNISYWRGFFNATNARGNYTANALAYDALLVNGTAQANFTTFAKMDSSLFTLKDAYLAGSSVSIYYKAKDAVGDALSPANVTLSVRDNASRLVYNSSFQNLPSLLEPLPQFTITSDQGDGNFTLYSNATFFDAQANVSTNETRNYSFSVTSQASSQLALVAEVSALDLLTDGDNATFIVTLKYSNGTLVDAESVNLSAYSDASTLFSVQKPSLSNTSAGVYSYSTLVTSSSTPGTYFAEVNASHKGLRTRALAFFRIKASLTAQVETTVLWYPQSIMTFSILLQDANGRPVDASDLNLTVFTPTDTVYFTASLINSSNSSGNFTKKDTGYYVFKYGMPLSTAVGSYVAVLNASSRNRTTLAVKPFRVSAGGPFDVIVDIPTPEVSPGSYLDFKLTLKNMGDISQDVNVDYWVTDGTRTWYSSSEAIYVPSQGTQVLARNAYVYNSQPLGDYTLNVKVTFDPIQAPVQASKSFKVKAAAPAAAVGGPPAAGPTSPTPGVQLVPPRASPTPDEAVYGLEIIVYPDEILVERGDTKFPKIVVKNTGLTALHDLQFFVSGIPASWVDVQPPKVNVFAAGDEETFLLRISVPVSAPAGIKLMRFIALAKEKKADRASQIAIFESRLALVEYELNRLDDKLAKISKEARDAEVVGKDVSNVWKVIEEASNYTSIAKENLQDDLVDDALGNARVAEVLLSKATALLVASTFEEPKLVQVFQPQHFPFLIVILIIIATAVGFFVYKRRKSLEKVVPAAIKSTEKVIEVLKVKTVEELEEERERLVRVFDLLEEELLQGVISKTAYSELRKRNESRLSHVQDMIKQKRSENNT